MKYIKCTCDFVHIYPFIIKQNKDVFTDIANHYWDVEKNGQYTFSIMICFSMLLFNEKHMVDTLLTDIHSDINNDVHLMKYRKTHIWQSFNILRHIQDIMILIK